MLPTNLPYTADEPQRITLGPEAIPSLRIAPTQGDGPRPCLVMQHGYGADKYDLAPIAEVIAGLGFVVILPDAWGHGERFDPTGPNWSNAFAANYFIDVARHVVDDLAQVVTALRRDPTLDPARIVLGGFSLGGITSVIATERDPAVAGLVAIAGGVAPASLMGVLGMATVDEEHRAWAEANDMGLAPNAAKLAPRPVLLMHGRRDDRLPVTGTERLFAAAQPAYAAQPEQLQLRLYDATHEITMPMLAEAAGWLVEHFGDVA
jgi:dienelactone hydrolase